MSTSSDGVVTATVDSTTASILLAVNFTVAGSPVASGSQSSITAITVTEYNSGRVVRGLLTTSAPGGLVAGIDHEATFDMGLAYGAVAYDASGAVLGTSSQATTTLPLPDGGPGMWLKSLATPSMSVSPVPAAAPQWDHDTAQGVIWVVGRPDPIVVQDVRRLPSTTLTVYTQTTADEAALGALLATQGPYLAQFPGLGSADCYVTVGKYSQVGVATSADPLRIWSLPLQQVVAPPLPGWSVAIPGHTYADSTARWPLYSNRTGSYLSRATT